MTEQTPTAHGTFYGADEERRYLEARIDRADDAPDERDAS